MASAPSSSRTYTFLEWGDQVSLSNNNQTAEKKSGSRKRSFVRVAQAIKSGDQLVVYVTFSGELLLMGIEWTHCGPDRIDVCSPLKGCLTSTDCTSKYELLFGSRTRALLVSRNDEGILVTDDQKKRLTLLPIPGEDRRPTFLDFELWRGASDCISFVKPSEEIRVSSQLPDGILPMLQQLMEIRARSASGSGLDNRVEELNSRMETEQAMRESYVDSAEQWKRQQQDVNEAVAGSLQQVLLQVEYLSQQVKDLKSAVASTAAKSADEAAGPVMWITSKTVEASESKISKTSGQSEGGSYAFRTSSLSLGTQITFAITELDQEKSSSSLSFGVTATDLEKVDLIALPASGSELEATGHAGTWFVTDNFLDHVKEGKVVSIKRTKEGIKVTSLSKDELVLTLDPYLRVYPFFLFDGSVSGIEIRVATYAVQRKSGECLMCGLRSATTFAKPCKHILFCDQCFETEIVTSGDGLKCRRCHDPVTGFEQIRWD